MYIIYIIQGECGNKSLQDITIPTRIYGLPGVVKDISAGQNHILTLTTNNRLYTWGSSEYGQLGIGKNKSLSYKPQEVYLPEDVYRGDNIKLITCGSFNNIIVTEKNNVYGWGSNTNGSLDLPIMTEMVLIPTKLNVFNFNKNKVISNILCLINFSMILKTNINCINIILQ